MVWSGIARHYHISNSFPTRILGLTGGGGDGVSGGV